MARLNSGQNVRLLGPVSGDAFMRVVHCPAESCRGATISLLGCGYAAVSRNPGIVRGGFTETIVWSTAPAVAPGGFHGFSGSGEAGMVVGPRDRGIPPSRRGDCSEPGACDTVVSSGVVSRREEDSWKPSE